jgi:HTH-type transcriptional regulator, sugar sensing transcriptional regulator
MINVDTLMESGLTKNESKVYLALIDLGPSLAGAISRKVGIHRRNVYDTCDRLIKKGLVGYILQNNRRVFSASNPSRFLDIIKERESLLLPLVSELSAKFSSTREKEETNFYKGKDGLRAVLEDQLNYKEVLILGANPKAGEIMQFYFKWYNLTRKKKRISLKIITHSMGMEKLPLSEVRYFPQKYASPLAINIYGDKTAIILWSKTSPLAVVIKNKDITSGYKQYFDLLWKSSKS